MTARFLALLNTSFSYSIWVKRGLTLTLVAASLGAQATPTGFREFTRDGTPTSGLISGKYTTPSGAKGSFVITRAVPSVGYAGEGFETGDNGIQILNNRRYEAVSDHNDKFSYTFAIIPDDSTSIHTIKIGQASYTKTGNSEVARQTLSFEQNKNFSVPVKAFIKENNPVKYYYEAMGDYFMGRMLQNTTDTFLAEQYLPNESQLRKDDSSVAANKLYYLVVYQKVC